jgi:hypothetical protein
MYSARKGERGRATDVTYQEVRLDDGMGTRSTLLLFMIAYLS